MLGNLDKFSKTIERNPPLRPYYSPFHCDQTLNFESRFESGNLELAIKVSDKEYNLILQHDTNTSGNTQWFFFSVSNTTQDLKVKFNILNLGKGDSLYNYGMKVLVHSEVEEKKNGRSWFRDGEDILYHSNSMYKPNTSKPYFTVTFSYRFIHPKDTVYFAYSFPYTYTDLMKYLLSLENDQRKNSLFSRKLLCHTIGGNRCDYLTITSSEIPEYMRNRKGVILSSRVHPGESVGSWMMQGAIDFLLSDCREAAIIRDNFVIKTIPMLNPDGVINGNYRCNLAGNDLNRKWKSPSRILQPTIYHAKRLIKTFAKERKLQLICDMHGHSRRMKIFMYGCNVQSDPAATREFPLILSKMDKNFEYKSCSFHMQKNKESTLRISMFNEAQVPNVYTLEASFCGGDGNHYTIEDLKNMGKSVCLALLVHTEASICPDSILINKKDIQNELKTNKDLLVDNPDTSGSESEPSEDNLDEEILKALLPKPIKKKKKKIKGNQKAKSVIKKRESLPARTDRTSISVDKEKSIPSKIDTKRCPDCGENLAPNHMCAKKLHNLSPKLQMYKRIERQLPGSLSSLTIYVNLKGKKVRDQATQTMYVKKPKPEVSQSASLINSFDKSPSKYRLENFIDTKRLKELMVNRNNPYLFQ